MRDPSSTAAGDAAQGDWTTRTYERIHDVASSCLARERGRTLAPTDLVHEAWLRMNASVEPAGIARAALAARAMREVLIDRARRRDALKRGTGRAPQALDGSEPCAERDAYLVRLDEALARLAEEDVELARLVELRFFGGLGVDEIARALELSPRTVKRRWQLAKGWLHREIGAS